MVETISADASPEKRLFISLLTRDIPLVAAFLDLIDNSVNSAIEPFASRLKTAADYLDILQNDSIKPSVTIDLNFHSDFVEILDNASGISSTAATTNVFKFGRSDGDLSHKEDRLSVYGIGLKRAIFKLGNRIRMSSDHSQGGFDLDLDVAAWERIVGSAWTFDISPRKPASSGYTGTKIVVGELHEDVSRRLKDGVFEGQLREVIGRTYAYFLSTFVKIRVNGTPVGGDFINIGGNYASDSFELNNVTCTVAAGISAPEGDQFRARASGWFIFCNGRTVISADKTPLTGWEGGGLPIFQPKHRPFLGTVFFVSDDPELLPWTTTKSGINEDSLLWQTAKRYMSSVGRTVISYLDGRYSDEGTEFSSKDLSIAAGTQRISAFTAAASSKQIFESPKKAPKSTIKIQYHARIDEVKAITSYLRQPSMSGSDVGRYTFNYFLRNEAGGK